MFPDQDYTLRMSSVKEEYEVGESMNFLIELVGEDEFFIEPTDLTFGLFFEDELVAQKTTFIGADNQGDFLVVLLSEENYVKIESYGGTQFGADEEAFLKEYLEKFPSRIK